MVKILYLHNVGLDSQKANLLQVISMCTSFARNGVNIELYIPESINKDHNSTVFFKKKYGYVPLFGLNFYRTKIKSTKINKYVTSRTLINILKSSDADFVFVRRHNFVKIALKANKKVIFESHNNLLHNRWKLFDHIFKRNMISLSRHPDFKLWVSISENLQNYWERLGVPKEKQIALHDGFDDLLFESRPSIAQARQCLDLPLDKKIITYTGSLYPDRGIESITRLARYLPDVWFCVVGGPDKERKFYEDQSRANHINNIHFTGRVPHSKIPLYLNASDILLALWSKNVPTINYCSPLKTFEYMAAGKTIVAHDFITIKEVLTDNENGLLVDPSSFKDLLDKTNLALTQKTNLLGDNARKTAFARHTWQKRVWAIIQRIS